MLRAYSTRFSWGFASLLVGLSAMSAFAGEPSGEPRSTQLMLGFNLGAGAVTGRQTITQGQWVHGAWMDVQLAAANSSDLFDQPVVVSGSFGFRKPDWHWLVTGDLRLTVIKSKRVLTAFSGTTLEPAELRTSEWIYLASVKVAGVRLFGNSGVSRILPQAGWFIELGTGNLERLTWQSSVFALGPEVACDVRLTGDSQGSGYMALHMALDYGISCTDGWPSQFRFGSGLRFFW